MSSGKDNFKPIKLTPKKPSPGADNKPKSDGDAGRGQFVRLGGDSAPTPPVAPPQQDAPAEESAENTAGANQGSGYPRIVDPNNFDSQAAAPTFRPNQAVTDDDQGLDPVLAAALTAESTPDIHSDSTQVVQYTEQSEDEEGHVEDGQDNDEGYVSPEAEGEYSASTEQSYQSPAPAAQRRVGPRYAAGTFTIADPEDFRPVLKPKHTARRPFSPWTKLIVLFGVVLIGCAGAFYLATGHTAEGDSWLSVLTGTQPTRVTSSRRILTATTPTGERNISNSSAKSAVGPLQKVTAGTTVAVVGGQTTATQAQLSDGWKKLTGSGLLSSQDTGTSRGELFRSRRDSRAAAENMALAQRDAAVGLGVDQAKKREVVMKRPPAPLLEADASYYESNLMQMKGTFIVCFVLPGSGISDQQIRTHRIVAGRYDRAVKVIAINAVASRTLMQKLQIRTFPATQIINNGVVMKLTTGTMDTQDVEGALVEVLGAPELIN